MTQVRYTKEHAQADLDRIVGAMVHPRNAQYLGSRPVEATNKNGHSAEHISADGYAWGNTKVNCHYYDEHLARALVGGWWEKAALVKLVFLLLREIRCLRQNMHPLDLEAADRTIEHANAGEGQHD